MPDAADRLDPQLRAALDLAARIAAEAGPPDPGIEGVRRHAEACRRHWNEGGPAATVSERTVPGPHRAVPVVLYTPAQAAPGPLPVFVYLHGGGFKTGTPWSNDRQMRELVAAWGGAVLSADYLHVPEHVFPAAVDETAAVLQWLHRHGAAWGLDGQRVACGGNSAGAAVALGAAVSLRSPAWLRAGVGIVGAFSADTSLPSMQAYGQAGLFPGLAAVPEIFDGYLPDPALRDDPRANLLRADPSWFPPTFLAAAELDIFRDASAALAQHLIQAHRLHALTVYPGMSHLFFGFSRSVAGSRACIEDIAAFLGGTV